MVDDGSPLSCTLANINKDNTTLQVLELEVNGGPAAARNAGTAAALQAGSRWICYTDVDCVPDPNWVEQMLAA